MGLSCCEDTRRYQYQIYNSSVRLSTGQNGEWTDKSRGWTGQNGSKLGKLNTATSIIVSFLSTVYFVQVDG